MGHLFLLVFLLVSMSTVTQAQTMLARSVIGNGGTVASPSANATMLLSSTIGQAVIFSQQRQDGNEMFQGFWMPLILRDVSVNDQNDDLEAGTVSNYPNPFATSTTIRFSVPMDGRVTIRVFNLIGVLVRTISADVSAAGSQEISFNAIDELGAPLAAGTFLYEVDGTTASGAPFRRTQRLNILR